MEKLEEMGYKTTPEMFALGNAIEDRMPLFQHIAYITGVAILVGQQFISLSTKLWYLAIAGLQRKHNFE